MKTREQILAALKKLGPSSPLVISDSIGGSASACSYHLRAMEKDGTLKAEGTRRSRRYALPDQKFDAADTPPPGAQASQGQEARQGEARPHPARAGRRARALHPGDRRGCAPGHHQRRRAAHLQSRSDAGDRHAAARSLRGLT